MPKNMSYAGGSTGNKSVKGNYGHKKGLAKKQPSMIGGDGGTKTLKKGSGKAKRMFT